MLRYDLIWVQLVSMGLHGANIDRFALCVNNPNTKRGKEMKRFFGCFALLLFITTAFSTISAQNPSEKIFVMNPIGVKPPIRQIPMAERPTTLDGKTVYVVDSRFPRTREFVETLVEVLAERYPRTDWVLKDKFGGYMDDDPELWADIQENAHGAIVTVGH